MEIYRPHFCWCRPAVKPISVHTSTGPCGRMEMHLEHELSTMRGKNFPSLSRLPLWASVFHVPFIFFYHSNDSILNTVRRFSRSPTFLPHWDPIKLGFVCKAAIETFPAFFFNNLKNQRRDWCHHSQLNPFSSVNIECGLSLLDILNSTGCTGCTKSYW